MASEADTANHNALPQARTRRRARFRAAPAPTIARAATSPRPLITLLLLVPTSSYFDIFATSFLLTLPSPYDDEQLQIAAEKLPLIDPTISCTRLIGNSV
jgi:hypothetical protein